MNRVNQNTGNAMHSAISSKPLRAGAAKVDISPVNDIQIAGSIGWRRPCSGVADPIYAHALVLEQAGRQFCILSVDVLAIDIPWANEIRQRVHQLTGIPREAVLLHATQNHSAPDIGNDFCHDSCKLIPDELPWVRGGDPRYNEPAVAGILESVRLALQRLTPVCVAAGRAIDGRLAVNRRYIMRDGTLRCQPPLCSQDILHVEGPIDPEVGVVTFTATDGRVVAVVLHHTAHPTSGYWGTQASSDWPGAWCREMETHFGANCTALVVNGCCGNIVTSNYLSPDQAPEREIGDYRAMGRLLAQSTKRALENMTPLGAPVLAWACHNLRLGWRKVPAQVIAESKRVLRQHRTPVWDDATQVNRDWLHAVGILDLLDQQRMQPTFPYEIQAIRLGDFALVAVGGEPFVEMQLAIKRDSPLPFTYLAHMSNGGIGYIPTRRAIAAGGYETMSGFGSPFAVEAAELIERATVRLLRKLAD